MFCHRFYLRESVAVEFDVSGTVSQSFTRDLVNFLQPLPVWHISTITESFFLFISSWDNVLQLFRKVLRRLVVVLLLLIIIIDRFYIALSSRRTALKSDVILSECDCILFRGRVNR